MGQFFSDITATAGRTPLVRLVRLPQGLAASIALKCEFFNPVSSVKDRMAAAMILGAEREGKLKSGGTVIEATSGNTGIALACVCAARGYSLILAMPDTMSLERRVLLALLGARLVLTPGEASMRGAMNQAEVLLSQTPGAYMPRQFRNPANPRVHFETTGPEIWEDTRGKIDIFVAGVGTGGTLTGVSEYLKSRNPDLLSVAVEPADSAVIGQTLAGKPLKPAPHKIQGLGAGFVPENLRLSLVDEVMAVTSEAAILTARRLAREEGVFAGISTGANVWAALQIARRPQNAGKLIATVACSTGERYLSTALAAEARAAVGG
jgi:cysteine synthase